MKRSLRRAAQIPPARALRGLAPVDRLSRAIARPAAFAIRRPWWMVAIWAVVLMAGIAGSSTIGGVLSSKSTTDEPLEADRASAILKAASPVEGGETEYFVLQSSSHTVDDAAFRLLARQILSQLAQLPGDVHAISYYDMPDPALVAEDRHTLIIPVVLQPSSDALAATERIAAGHDGAGSFSVGVVGESSLSRAFVRAARDDLRTAELIGLPIAAVVLIVVFGGLAAAGLPIGLGIGAIVVAVGATALLGRVLELSAFTLNMIAMIGLAVGIDYSLLVVQRFREERQRGLEKREAVSKASATAGRSVLFSGFTVLVALSGLLIVPDSTFRSMAIGSILVVIVAVLASLTLLPALLTLLGDRVNGGRIPIPRIRFHLPGASRLWHGCAGLAMRRPGWAAAISVALLAAASLPYLSIKLGSTDPAALPPGTSAARAAKILDAEFGGGALSPASVVIQAPNVEAGAIQIGIEQLREQLAEDPDFGVATASAGPGFAVLSVPTRLGSESESSSKAITRLRDQYIPAAFAGTGATVFVGGQAAWFMDYTGLVSEFTPFVYALVLGLSFIVLLVLFRSLVVPIKAILMNLLSVGAACGLIVVTFQMGLGSTLLGLQHTAHIEPWVPVFLFAILFGLSMDYHIFLLSRIREQFDLTNDNRGAVVFGLRKTAGTITGAALIMVAVFATTAMGDLAVFQQMGFGLAVAIFLDATIVRLVLVPASMTLLGRWNWYLPNFMRWLPKLSPE